MRYITLEERKIQREKNKKFISELHKDINSNKPYSEKKYLQEFNDMIKKNESYNKCRLNQCNGGYVFYTNQYNSNNVNISGISYSNYYGHCSPSFF